MPLYIVRNEKEVPVTGAAVMPLYAKGLKGLFGPAPGTVTVSAEAEEGGCRIRVILPGRHNAEGYTQMLRSCYGKVLALAEQQDCACVRIPLLAGKRIPPGVDFAVAVEEIREFLARRELDVYLLIPHREESRMQSLRRDIARLLAGAPAAPAPEQSFAPREVPMPSAGMCEPCAPAPDRSRMGSRTVAGAAPRREELERILKQTDAGFSETLLRLIDRSGKKDSEIYTKANISRQHFSKIRNNPAYKPTKATALALAIALELDMDRTLDLIGRAGYTLTGSSKFDVIIMYFIRRGNYDLFEINEMLYAFDQSLLGV